MTWNIRETLEAYDLDFLKEWLETKPGELYTIESGIQRHLAMIDLDCHEPKKDPHRKARVAYWGAVAYKLLKRKKPE